MKKRMLLLLLSMLLFGLLLHADIILSEGFEGSVIGWTFGTAGEENVWEYGNATSNTGTKAAYISNDSGNTASYAKNQTSTSWLEKTVDLTGYSSASLSFYWKCVGQGGTIARDYGEVYINNGLNHLVSSAREFVDQPNWTLKTIDISSYTGETIVIKFKWSNNSSAGNDPPFCVDDIGVSATANHDFASLSHNQDSRAMQDTVITINTQIPLRIVTKNIGDVSESGPVKWVCSSGTPLNDTNETSSVLSPNDTEIHTFSPFWTAPSTAGVYTLKLYTELVGDTDSSNDTTYVEITVLEPQNIPYEENFDEVADAPALAEGWTYENSNSDAFVWQTNASYPRSPLNSVAMYGTYLRSTDDWLFSEPLSLSGGVHYRISFWAVSTGTDIQKLGLYFGQAPYSSQMSASSIYDMDINSNNYEEQVAYFTPSSSGNYYIGWYCHSTSNSGALILDDIKIREEKSHDFGVLDFYDDDRSVHDMVVTPGTNVSLSITVRNEGEITESSPVKWICNGGSPMVVSETSSVLAKGNSEQYIFSSSWTAPSVEGEYNMTFYTDLSTDQYSANDATSIVITVISPNSVPYSENFDSIILPSLPAGWSTENANRDFREWGTNDLSPYDPPNHMLITENPNLDMDDWLFSHPISLTANKTYNLEFWMSTGGLEQTLEILWGSKASSDGMEQGQIFTITTSDANYWNENISITPTTSGDYYFGWHGVTIASGSVYSNLSIDNVSVTEEDVHDFMVLDHSQDSRSMQDITTTVNSTIALNFVVKNNGTYTESSPIKWTCTGGTPTSDTNESTSVLSPQTTENHSFSPVWTAPSIAGTYTMTFFTDLTTDQDNTNDQAEITIAVLDECNALSVIEDFSSGLVYFENAIGNDTDWTTNDVLYHSYPYSAWNSYGNNEENILRQSCVMDLTTVTSPYLTFWHIAKTENGFDKCFVEVSTDLGGSWDQLTGSEYFGEAESYSSKTYFDEDSYSEWGSEDEIPTNSWWKREIFDLSSYSMESEVMIRFRLLSNYTTNRYGWLIDDITIQEMNLPELAYNPEPSDYEDMICTCLDNITWENGLGTTAIDLYLGTNYSDVENLSVSVKKISNQNVNTYSLDQLNFNTAYFWRVVSKNSNGDNAGDIWRFTTNECEQSRFEDFESGDFSSLPWTTDGDANWIVQNSSAIQGNFSAQAGPIGNNQSSNLSIDLNLTNDGYVSFSYQVSSEENYDELEFYIDGVKRGSWSGDITYADVNYYVSSGLRNFKWSYKKNVSGFSGNDTAWIDCICFPSFITAHPDAPENLSLQIDGNDVVLSWDVVDSALEYNIYRSISPTTGFVLLDTAAINTYIDVNAANSEKMYYYYVTAVNSAK